MDLNIETGHPVALISDETKQQRRKCWSNLFEKYENIPEDKPGSIDVKLIVRTFAEEAHDRRNSTFFDESILASSNKKKNFLNYSTELSYNIRRQGRPRKVPKRYSDENWASGLDKTPQEPKYIDDSLIDSVQKDNKSEVTEDNDVDLKSALEESVNEEREKYKIKRRYVWKNSFLNELVMKRITKRKKKLNKKTKQPESKATELDISSQPPKNKTYMISDDFKTITPVVRLSPLTINETVTEDVKTPAVEIVSSTSLDMTLAEQTALPIETKVMEFPRKSQDMPSAEQPALPIQIKVMKFPHKLKGIPFTTKYKIEKELKSELGYMVYKRHQCLQFPSKSGEEGLDYWNNAVKMEIQKLSLVIQLEELYKYMRESLLLWISLADSNSVEAAE